MNISENTRTYLFVSAAFLMIVFLIYHGSTEKKFSCDDWANGFRIKFSCNLVLTGKDEGAITTFTGLDLDTKKIVDCEDDSKWLVDNFDEFKIGDTIIKKKGEYSIRIKRKGKTILIPFECDKIYQDK